MSAVITCDGCGTTSPMQHGPYGWEEPEDWLQRVDLGKGVQDACSRDCAERVVTFPIHLVAGCVIEPANSGEQEQALQ